MNILKTITQYLGALFILLLLQLDNQILGQCSLTDICNGAGSYSCCYGDSENLICTYCPDNPGDAVSLTTFGGELYSGGDYFRVYEGTGTGGTLLAEFQGTSTIDALLTYTSTDPSGCLTVQIFSDFVISCGASGTGQQNPIEYEINYICTPPVPDVAFSPQPACSQDALNYQEITFNGEGSFSALGLEINDYVWDFGDGQSETGAIVTHGYDLPGGYIGSLTITDASGCEETTDFFVEVSGAPFEWFTLGVEEVCPLDAIQLTSLVNVPYSWSETFESELIEGPFYPDFPGAPDDDGNFSVTIPIEAPEGIVVTNPNEISITIDMATSFAGDLQIILSCPNGSQANILQYPNSLGGTDMGNPVAGVPLAGSGLPYTITPNASQTLNIAGAGVPVNASIPAGDYLPEQSFNAFNGCPIDGNWTLTVIDNLGIDFVLVYDVQLSFGEAADSPLSESFICESNNDDIYWIDQDGSIVNDGVFTAPGTPGTYTYTSVIPNECGCEYTQEFDVVVSDPAVNILCANCPPSGSIDLSASSDGPYCEGDVYQLNASSTEDPALVEYSWSGEGGFTSDLPNPIAPTAGLYEVLITVDGCPSVPESVLVEVNTSPKGSDFQIICVGDSYELPDGTIVTPTDDMVFSDIPTGFTADNGCDSLVNVSIVVNAIPEVALSDIALCQDNNFIDLSLITVLPLGGDWYSGDNSTTGTLISESDYFQDGLVDQQQFYYELVDAAGCAGGAVMTAYVGENPAIDFQDVACLSTTEFTFNLFVGQLGGTYDVQIEPDADGFPLNDINGGVAIPINLPLGQTYELFAELTVGAGCESDAIEVVAPNCGCPIVEDAPDLVVDFCMEGLADTIGFLDNVTVTNLDNLGGFAWFTDDTYTTEAIDFELSHNGIGSNCDAETATFYAAFSCLNNTIPIPAGSITINVYPDVSQAEINLENDGTCGPSVVDYDCAENPNYTLTNDYDENGATPDFTNELSTNTFTFTLENVLAPVECADLEVEASYFCVNCPQIDPDDSASNICDGSAFDYESLAASLSIENPNGNNIQFFINNDDPENPQEEYTGELLSGLTDVICEPAEIVLHAFILCDEDADTGTPDIWVDLSYTHTLTIYPSELPEITVEGDCQVNPIITVPECETYLNITPELFEYNPGENGNDEFLVTFDYPTNIDGDCIESTAVPFDYNCPAACPSIVNNPLNEQFDLCDNGNAIVNLLDEQESISTDLDANAEFVWFDTNGDQVTGDLTAIPINHSGNNCNPETFTFTLEVACQGDANFDNLDGGTYTIVLYPSVDAAWFEVPNSESCTAVIVDSCPDNPDNPGLDIQYSLDGGNNFSDTSPTDLNPGESQTITYQISVAGAPNNCSIENTYEINCPLADCPASNFGNPATENICANGIPNLPQLGIDYDISDLGGTQLGGVTWYFDSDFNNPYNEGDPIPFNGNDACAAGPPTSLTAWVECDNNNDNVPDQNIPVAEHIVVVFPEPGGVTLNGPSVSAVDGVCTFTIVATCPDDVLSLPTFTTTPGEEGGTQTVTVTSSIPDNPCVEISVDLDYSACPSADCFISDFQDVVTESLCSGDTPTLPELGTDFNLEGNANTQDGDVVWFSGTDPDVDPEYTPEPVSITGCEASDVTTVSAFVQCNDGTGTSWVPVASHNFQVYPLVETPTVIGPDIQADGTCGFSIAPACPMI